jgi:hypothetical protein
VRRRVCGGGRKAAQRLGPAAKMSEATKAAASKIISAIGIEFMHKQEYMMATLIQELRNEELFMADLANGEV